MSSLRHASNDSRAWADQAERVEQFEIWIREARAGSETALGKLLAAAHRYLLRIANQSVPESLRAKMAPSDIVQETALEAFRDFRTFEGHRYEELLAWLRRILLNNAANTSRHFEGTQKRQTSREISINGPTDGANQLSDPHPSPSKCLDASERELAIEKALAQLPVDMRSAIVLRNREHLSFGEIGVRLERSADAARKLWARAIERLQQELG